MNRDLYKTSKHRPLQSQPKHKPKTKRENSDPSLNLFSHHSNPSTGGSIMRPCKIWIRLTEVQADNHLAAVLKEEEERHRWRPTGVDLPAYIQVAARECSARLAGQLQHGDTIDRELWEGMVHDTVAAHREEAEYELAADNHCNCKDPWCPC